MSQTRSSKPKRPTTPGQVISITLLGMILIVIGFLGYPLIKTQPGQPNPLSGAPTATGEGDPEAIATTIPLATLALPPELSEQGTIFLSISDGAAIHLFAYHPQLFPLTRITNEPWDDINPALSPDGNKLAYGSRKNGYWNLYVLNLSDGSQTQLTDSPAYEGAPAWSPDNQWITYESYADQNLEIYIQNTVDPSIVPIRLTDNSTADYSPNWSPAGRIIAYVSTSGQNSDVWIANLDNSEDRFINLTNTPGIQEKHPVWSPDGQKLAWVSNKNGINEIWVWDFQSDPANARLIGRGDWPAWSPNGEILLTTITDPNQIFLTAYQLSDLRVMIPPVTLPGEVYGLEWRKVTANDGRNILLPQSLQAATPALYEPVISVPPLAPTGRYSVQPLPSTVNAPFPYLHDAVDEAFLALRTGIGQKAGWDLLLALENAYIPLTSPPSPGIPENWLYTGRAFAFNPLPTQSDWMVIAREEFNGITYWRVFMKARYQDGSQGFPLTSVIWNLNARYSGNPIAYEEGGEFTAPPSGYWVDLTDIAAQYKWQRLPALRNWRTYYPAARFNQFVITNGLSWLEAMREIYPEEALITPTYIPTYTSTPVTPTVTPTRRFYRTPTPGPLLPTSTPVFTTTIRPTLTPPAPTP